MSTYITVSNCTETHIHCDSSDSETEIVVIPEFKPYWANEPCLSALEDVAQSILNGDVPDIG